MKVSPVIKKFLFLNNRQKRVPLLVLMMSGAVVMLHADSAKKQYAADGFRLCTPRMEIVFTQEGDINTIRSKWVGNRSMSGFETFSGADFSPLFTIQSAGGTLHPLLQDTCLPQKSQTDSTIVFEFRSALLVKRYEVHKKSHVIDVKVRKREISGGCAADRDEGAARISLRTTEFSKETKRHFSIDRKGKVTYFDLRDSTDCSAAAQKWLGVRERFWTVMVRPESNTQSAAVNKATFEIVAQLRDDAHFDLRLYAGPIVRKELEAASPECTKLLYPLWFWMRWLSVGLELLFDLLLTLTSNCVVAIILLSVCVKIIIAPLFKIADDWQKQVNVQKSRLQPRLDEINRKYRGEEQNRRTLELYRELGIHPLYSLKSLLSAAIQIPVFFAAYHTLSEHIALQGVSFAWIRDLSLPDSLFRLPFLLPYIGGSFNLLPFLMTFITIASSRVHYDHSLSPELVKKQRRSLYWMAALFFVMLYPSAAGMVIYWTMNNALAFLSSLYHRFSATKRGSQQLQRSSQA